MNLDQMISYLRAAIEFNTASDIYELPREEFVPYVDRCREHVPKAAIPYVVLFLLIEEQKSFTYKVKKLFKSKGK